MSRDSPLRRVSLVLLVYVGAGWVLLGGAGWLRRTLALPESFDLLIRGALLVGVPIAIWIAWHFPQIGHHGREPDRTGGPPRRSPRR